MAIIIPSKNIYNVDDNNKLIDNQINVVDVEINEVSPDNQYDVSVYSEKKQVSTATIGESQESLVARAYETYRSGQAGTDDSIRAKIAYVSCTNKQKVNYVIKVPVLQKNKYITQLLTGINEETDNYNIGVQLYGYVNKYSASSTWFCQGKGTQIGSYTEPTVTKSTIDKILVEDVSNQSTTIYLPENMTIATTSLGLPNNFEANLDITDIGNLETATYSTTTENGVEYFVIELEIMCGFDITTLTGVAYKSGSLDVNVPVSGEILEYRAKYIEVTLKGDTIGIAMEDTSASYGSGKKPFTLNGNELLQDDTTTNNMPTSEYLANTVLEQYKNGKETATILVGINDYYDQQGNKVIDTNNNGKMTFEAYDEVVPYVYSESGKDVAISRDNKGNAKVFVVQDIEFFYDGAVWQRLKLLEK